MFVVVLCWISLGSAAFDPNEFIIGACDGPALKGITTSPPGGNDSADRAMYRELVDEHYNAIILNLVAPHREHYSSTTAGATPNIYRLERLEGLPIKTLVFDHVVGTNNCHLQKKCWGVGAQKPYVHAGVLQYTKLRASLQERMIGYYVQDEPSLTKIDTTWSGVLTEEAAVRERISWIDHTGMIGWGNLLPYFPTALGINWTQYCTMVDNWCGDPGIKVLSFDVYPIMNNSGTYLPTKSQYWVWSGSGCGEKQSDLSFFKVYEYYISHKRADQRFWTFIEGGAPDAGYNCECYVNFSPDLYSARFCMNTALIYGSQGIWWYTWNSENTKTCTAKNSISRAAVRTAIAGLNAQLSRMAPVLMSLTWLSTVHGTIIDSQTQENGLKTPDAETQVLKMGKASLDSYLAIGVFKEGSAKYLMVFNKDLSATNPPRTQTIVLNGTQYLPKNFNMNTGNWEPLASTKNSKNKTTAFKVTSLGRTEMRLIQLTQI